MAHPEIELWISTAVGIRMNPDRHYGLQCVDLVDQYGQDIFGVPWNVCVGGVNGARELLDAVPDKYWIRIDNDESRPDQIPQRGDVVVMGGTAQNPYGHTFVCLGADQSGMDALQQDGFAPPTVFVDGGWYSDKPAHTARLPYWGPGTGSIIGWLRPREEMLLKTIPDPEPVPEEVLPFQRVVGAARVAYRKSPGVNGEFIQWLEPDHKYDFKGFVVDPAGGISGEARWLIGKYTGGFAWLGGFTDQDTHDLPDLTSEVFPVVPPPPVAPVDPVTFPHMVGFDVSNHQENASLNLIMGDFAGIKATEGGGDWVDPALASNVAEARLGGKRIIFYHYARPFSSPGNTAAEELRSFLTAITPHLQEGDLIALDWEAENQNRTDWALDWLRGAKAVTGATGLIYLNRSAISENDWTEVRKEFPLWLASYGSNEPIGGYKVEAAPTDIVWDAGIAMWQYTSRGRLDNYTGDLDLNTFYGDGDRWKSLGVIVQTDTKPTPPDPIVVVPGADPALVRQIIDAYQAWLAEQFLKEHK